MYVKLPGVYYCLLQIPTTTITAAAIVVVVVATGAVCLLFFDTYATNTTKRFRIC